MAVQRRYTLLLVATLLGGSNAFSISLVRAGSRSSWSTTATPQHPRQRSTSTSCLHATTFKTIRLRNGNEASLISRTLPIPSTNTNHQIKEITVWEWQHPAQVVEDYWQAQQTQLMNPACSSNRINNANPILDPFGMVTWPGSVVAAQLLCENPELIQKKQTVLVLGAGVGVEVQAAAQWGSASRVIATDIHPTTLQQCMVGVESNDQILDKSVVTTQLLDLFQVETQQLPRSDVIVVADVLYSDSLADQVIVRLVEAHELNPDIRMIVTDSQGYTQGFDRRLQQALEEAGHDKSIQWTTRTLTQFTGSGVAIDDDQTYDCQVRTLCL